jgi:alkanesulfonate monooxygenase SsuD/methylene tetrahydromethanopterin reductase-like flavin-dependent oxidoreductase (luciferase family)
VKLGLMMPRRHSDGSPLRPDSIAQTAQAIAQAGFDSIWVNDGIGRDESAVDPLTVLTVCATATSTLELGTGILQLPLRGAVELTHRIMSTHLICGDRLLLGVGAGSTRADFDACGVDFHDRFALFDAALDTLRRLYRGETVGAARLRGWPATAEPPPLLLGTWGAPTAIRRAATEFDGWVGSAKKGQPLNDAIKRFRAAGGGRAVLVTIDVDLDAADRPTDPEAPFTLRCPPAEAARRLRWLRDLGFDDVVLRSARTDPRTLDALRTLLG